MKSFFGVCFALVLSAGSASALSCLQPTVESAYAQAAASKSDYIIVDGVVSFDARKLPRAPRSNPNAAPRETLIKARIKGLAMSRAGFDHKLDREITLSVPCLGPWCGGLGAGERYLAFLRKDGAGYVLEAGPCGGWAFGGDTRAHAQAAYRCYTSGGCKSAKPRRR